MGAMLHSMLRVGSIVITSQQTRAHPLLFQYSYPRAQGCNFEELATAVYCAGILRQPIDAAALATAVHHAHGKRALPDVAALWQGVACALATQPSVLAAQTEALRAALEGVHRGFELQDVSVVDAQRLLRVHHAVALLCPGEHLLHDVALRVCETVLEGTASRKPQAANHVLAALKQLREAGLVADYQAGPVQLLPGLCVDAVVWAPHGPAVAVVCDASLRWIVDAEGERHMLSGRAVLHRAVATALGLEYAVVDVAAAARGVSVVAQLRSALRMLSDRGV